MLLLIGILGCILLVHFFKMLRLYLVLMEHKMPFLKFVLLYIRTTFVNLAIPFKLGELYRIEEIARQTKVWQVGILSVLVDRFFDTVSLTLLLLPIDLLVRGRISIITMVFLVLIVLLMFLYLVYPASDAYLNHYLIVKRSSARTMAALRGLDILRTWYAFMKQLIRGRFALILMASFLGWSVELGALSLLARYQNATFALGDFIAYIEAIFTQGSSALLQPYTRMGLIFILVCGVVGYLIQLVLYIKTKENPKKSQE